GSDRARNRSEHNVPGFGLPPGIDDWAAVVADHFAVPHPRLGIDWFTNRAQQAQAVELVFFGPLISPLQKGPNRGGGGIKDVYFVAVNDAPETIGLGSIGCALVHQAGGAVLQRSVNDVAVTCNPTDVGGTPVGVFFFE